MTTAVKPLPPHGTYARSVGRPSCGIRGCSCAPCKDARNAYKRRRELLNTTGRTLMVSAGPATAHLRHLHTEGASWRALRDASGCSGSTISHLIRGRRTIIQRRVQTAILRVQLTDVLAPWRPVDATGSIRRIRALMAIGHFSYDIATAGDLDKSIIVHLTNGHLTTVRADTADKIRTAYAALCGKPGGSVRNRRRAAREGWPSPIAWDDDIDDPTAKPDLDNPPETLNRTEIAEIRRNEVEFLAAAGCGDDEIARRVGLSESSVDAIRRELRTGKKRDRTLHQVAA